MIVRTLDAIDQPKADAMLHRFDPSTYQLTPHARSYAGSTLIELAADCLKERGVTTLGLSRMDIAAVALRGGYMTTSDFPNILANVASKLLRDSYAATPQTFRPFTRQTTVADFKPVKRVQLGEAPRLEPVKEHGEFHRGVMGEASETYSIATYGKIISITRQMLVNDDLNAFGRVARAFGAQAANLESDIVWSLILANAAMGDGTALFHADHNNLASPGAAISVTSVGAARVAMTTQKGLDGVTPIGGTDPTWIIVPKALQTTAEQFRGQLFPTAASGVTPDSIRSLGIISEPRLDSGVSLNGVTYSGSATAWYAAGDQNQIDIVELAHLEGSDTVMTEVREGFDVDGIEVKARLDVGAKVLDWRGLYKNSGP